MERNLELAISIRLSDCHVTSPAGCVSCNLRVCVCVHIVTYNIFNSIARSLLTRALILYEG